MIRFSAILLLPSSFLLGESLAAPAHCVVERDVLVSAVPRVGNLGLWISWGAEQLSANIIKNPGFEGVNDRVNRVPPRDLCRLHGNVPDIRAYAFHSARGWSAALVSRADCSTEIQLSFPASRGTPPSRVLLLRSDHATFTNESAECVRILAGPVPYSARTLRLRLPFFGFAVSPAAEVCS